MLVADLLNGIIFESGNLARTNAVAYGVVAFLIPGTLFMIVASNHVLIAIYNTYTKLKKTDYAVSKTCEMTLISIVSFIGVIIYFVADNYYLVEQIRHNKFLTDFNSTTEIGVFVNINSIQPPLLVLGIIFHQAIPRAIKAVTRPHTKDPDSADEDSIYLGVMNMTVATLEFDSLFTLIQTIGICLKSIDLAFAWVLWTHLMIVYIGTLIFRAIQGYVKSYKYSKIKFYDLVWGVLVIILTWIAFGLYLLGDNRHPLDCYLSLSDRVKSILRLSFLVLAFVNYSFLATYFFIGLCIILINNGRTKVPLQIPLDAFV